MIHPTDAAARARTEATLPSPPDDRQKYAYLGGQRRWALVCGFLVATGAILSQVRFSLSAVPTLSYLPVAGFVAVVASISLYTSTRRRRIDETGHRARVSAWADGRTRFPSVDVFLPSCGEPLEVLANTFGHVAAMRWPGPLEVLVLDDSARPAVADLARRHGFTYLSRPDRGVMKKAGNLTFGYGRSSGDVIAVFDADFVPRPDYLFELVPYLDDPGVGIVQSPQFFESTAAMNWLQRGAGATQEFFYRWVQPSRDAAGSPICVGTCALYRRAALAAAGGFALIGHSEDVHTGVKLLRAGYRTRYVPVNVSKGLCPDTLDAFVTQQYRWCTGSMSLLADRRFHAMPLTLRQRLCFFSGFGYYIGTALLVFAVPIPSLAMMWLYTDYYHARNYVYVLPVLLWSWIVVPRLLRGRWGPEMFRVQVIYAFAHAIAIWDILRRRTAAWVPTGSVTRGAPLPGRVRRLMRTWIVLTQVGLWTGLAHAATANRAVLSSLPLAMIMSLTAVIQWPILARLRTPRPRAWARAHSAWRAAGAALAATAAVGVVTTAAMSAEVLVPVTSLLPDSLSMATTHTPAQVQEPDPTTARVGHGAQRCPVARATSRRTFVDRDYEGSRYRIGYVEQVTYCVRGNRVHLLAVSTQPDLVDSRFTRLRVTDVDHREAPCGQRCGRTITTVRGEARNVGQHGIAARATATITTTITPEGATTVARFDYRRA